MIEYHGYNDALSRLFDNADATDEFIRFLTVRFDVDRVIDSDGREYVQVIRCKDCANLLRGNFNDRCAETYDIVDPNHFCSWGVRS